MAVAYVIQTQACGLCDVIFCALPLIAPHGPVVVGLPDTVWFPEDALCRLALDCLAFLLFAVDIPQPFDAVVMDADGHVSGIEVKASHRHSRWIWGAFRTPGHVLHKLHALWLQRGRADEYIGTLVNAWIARRVCAGERHVDVGMLGGYHEATGLLGVREEALWPPA